MTQIKLIASTLVLTAIIWVYADSLSQGSRNVVVLVRLEAANPQEAVPVLVGVAADGMADTDVVRVRAELSGANLAVRRLAGVQMLDISVRIPEDQTGQQRTLDLVTAINESAEIRERGLRAVTASPQVVDVFVDRWMTVSFTVQPDRGRYAASVPPERILLQPTVVKGRLRESHLKQLGTDTPVVPLRVQELLTDAQDTVGPISVRLPRSVGDIPVTFEPAEVEFSAMLSRKTVLRQLLAIPVGVLVKNSDMLGDYRIEWADAGDRFVDIEVQVPADRAASLVPQSVQAFVVIDKADAVIEAGALASGAAAARYVRRTVEFVFPPGYEGVQCVGDPPTVQLRVTENAKPAPTGVTVEAPAP